MPLRDHFHPPLDERSWHSFYMMWSTCIGSLLNADLLPNDYHADIRVQLNPQMEVDSDSVVEKTEPPALEWEAIFPKRVEVLVFKNDGGPRLVSAIELISPGNKDRNEYRRAFAVKCANYLHHGIGLVIVDIVTNRGGNLHNTLVDLLELGAAYQMSGDAPYVVAYRPVRIESKDTVQAWPNGCEIGDTLPTVPLALDQGLCLPLDLETTYTTACGQMRLPN